MWRNVYAISKEKENPFVDVKEALILKEHYKTINNELLEENQLLTQQIESLTAQLAELKRTRYYLKAISML